MKQIPTSQPVGRLSLPEAAPRVRLTASPGSAAEKTWNLRRPVTLIGSRRPAHIVIHDPGIAKAHCVIVNDGTHALLRDLHTDLGTKVNGRRAEGIAVLADGDTLEVGTTTLVIAIEAPAAGIPPAGSEARNRDREGAARAAAGIPARRGSGTHGPTDPKQFIEPVALALDGSNATWQLAESIVVIGRLPKAAIRLEHPNISKRHAVVFQFEGSPAVFDAGSRTGVWLDGERCTYAPLMGGARILIGPFALTVRTQDGVAGAPGSGSDAAAGDPCASEPALSSPFALWQRRDHTHATTEEPALQPAAPVLAASCDTDVGGAKATDNCEGTRATSAAGPSEPSFHEVPESRPAAAREPLADPAVPDPASALSDDPKEVLAEIARREAALSTREHLLAQRWMQLRGSRCVHCGKPLSPSHHAPA